MRTLRSLIIVFLWVVLNLQAGSSDEFQKNYPLQRCMVATRAFLQENYLTENSSTETYFQAATLKLYAMHRIRVDLVRALKTVMHTTEDREAYLAAVTLRDALKYIRVDLYPVLHALHCIHSLSFEVQFLTVIYELLSQTFIKCSVHQVLIQFQSGKLFLGSEDTKFSWLEADQIGHMIIPLSFGVEGQYLEITSTELLFNSIWHRIVNGAFLPQRLFGLIILNLTLRPCTIKQQQQLGHFLYSEKIPNSTWSEIESKSIVTQNEFMNFIHDILQNLENYFPDMNSIPTVANSLLKFRRKRMTTELISN